MNSMEWMHDQAAITMLAVSESSDDTGAVSLVWTMVPYRVECLRPLRSLSERFCHDGPKS